MTLPIENANLQTFNTFQIPAKTRYLLKATTAEGLAADLQQPTLINQPHLVLGSGSNILFTQHFPGLVIKNEIKGITTLRENTEHVWLQVGAGEIWHELVQYCLSQHYGGIENLSLIPGTVGAAPIQNIGAYGVELASVLDSLEALHLKEHRIDHFTASDCAFGYRDSVFKNALKDQYLITTVTLRLDKTHSLQLDYPQIQAILDKMAIDTPTIQHVSDAVIQLRQHKLPNPNTFPNAGSFFKNPIIDTTHYATLKQTYPDLAGYAIDHTQYKLSAAWLIEKAGFKGHREQHVGVSPNHALVLVNYGSQDGQAIVALANKIQTTVRKQFAITLTPEVRMV